MPLRGDLFWHICRFDFTQNINVLWVVLCTRTQGRHWCMKHLFLRKIIVYLSPLLKSVWHINNTPFFSRNSKNSLKHKKNSTPCNIPLARSQNSVLPCITSDRYIKTVLRGFSIIEMQNEDQQLMSHKYLQTIPLLLGCLFPRQHTAPELKTELIVFSKDWC